MFPDEFAVHYAGTAAAGVAAHVAVPRVRTATAAKTLTVWNFMSALLSMGVQDLRLPVENAQVEDWQGCRFEVKR